MRYILHRIQDYLANGGLFNPESMDHEKVSELIRDCRDYIKEQHEINERCNQTIKELRLVNIMEDTVAKYQTVKCKVNEPYVERAPVGEFKWFIYNILSGHIVASTYSEQMAKAILVGIENDKFYIDNYAICEKYRGPEPMV